MFIDQYPPASVMKYGFVSTPRFSTSITAVASGAERRNRNWMHPLHTFPFRDPLDFASRDLPAPDQAPVIGPTDQVIGVGDGQRAEFQLVRSYTFGGESYQRKISKPVVSTVVVALNAQPPEEILETQGGPYTWTVDRETGVITFDKPVYKDLLVTAGFLFDVEVRFETDDAYDGIVRAYRVSGHADVVFVEVRPC